MIDTDSKLELKTKALMKEKSPEDRLIMGCSMFTFSKIIVQSSIIQKDRSILPCDLKRKLFLRFYGNDMDENTREKIANYFSNH